MIEIFNPGWLAIIVDNGRYGYGDIGVPPSSALDNFAYSTLNYLTGNHTDSPVMEVMGRGFAIMFDVDITCAITGAKVSAYINDVPLKSWTSFKATKGSILRVKEVTEGLRYYVGFSGDMVLEKAIESFSTNLECRFGGYKGRPLMKGDIIEFNNVRIEEENAVAERYIPSMNPPHLLRITEGPEIGHFTPNSLKDFLKNHSENTYSVSTKLNRTGIRLEGKPLLFREKVDKSIISEGILPGTIQIPGDGQPIIMLYERSVGGYARIATVARIDIDMLAHLKPKDKVLFQMLGIEQAETLWVKKKRKYLMTYFG